MSDYDYNVGKDRGTRGKSSAHGILSELTSFGSKKAASGRERGYRDGQIARTIADELRRKEENSAIPSHSTDDAGLLMLILSSLFIGGGAFLGTWVGVGVVIKIFTGLTEGIPPPEPDYAFTISYYLGIGVGIFAWLWYTIDYIRTNTSEIIESFKNIGYFFLALLMLAGIVLLLMGFKWAVDWMVLNL